MPVHRKLWGDVLPTKPAWLGEVREGKLKGLPKIMCFNGITHILHPRLIKFHCSLQLRGLMKHADNLAMEKVVKNVSQRGNQGGLRIHSHGYTRVALCSVGYTCPCKKASRTSMSFSRVFGTISNSPACLAFSSFKLRWNAVIAGSIDCR